MRAILRSTIVLVVGLAAAVVGTLGTAAGAHAGGDPTVERPEESQAWGFVEAPGTIEVGRAGSVVVAWRNASDETRTFRVGLLGPVDAALSWGREIVAAPGESFRREVSLPRLPVSGLYRATLSEDGAADALAGIDIRARSLVPGVLDLRTGAGGLAPEAHAKSRRSLTTTFRLDRTAHAGVRVLDRAGRVVLRRDLGLQAAGRTVRWTWSGLDRSGRVVAAGRYTLEVAAHAAGRRGSERVQVRVSR